MMEVHSSARVCDFNDPAKCDLTFSSGDCMRNTLKLTFVDFAKHNRTCYLSYPKGGGEWGSHRFNSMSCASLTGLKKLMKTSRDYQELAHAWRAWRDNTGRTLRPQYSRLTTLVNKAAKLNGKTRYSPRFSVQGEEWWAE